MSISINTLAKKSSSFIHGAVIKKKRSINLSRCRENCFWLSIFHKRVVHSDPTLSFGEFRERWHKVFSPRKYSLDTRIEIP